MTQHSVTKLRDVPVLRKTVELSSGHHVEVRGVNASDLLILTTMFGPQIAMAWARFKTQTADGQVLTNETMLQLTIAVANDVPALLGWIIAVASDDPTEELATIVNQFPIVDQASLINEIINETFTNEATVKKLTESLGTAFLTIYGALKTQVEPGSGVTSSNRSTRRAAASKNGTGK